MNQPTLMETALKAQQVFHQNIDTLVAGFLIRNPDVDPADVEIVVQTTSSGIRFSLEPKELHVPTEQPTEVGHQRELDYARGWNACREAMIAKAKDYRTPKALVSTLGESNGI